MSLYPWQSEIWAEFTALRTRLPHAILLHGRQGIGKLHLARMFAQGILCEARGENGEPCGQCPACTWFSQGHHPDFREVAPEEEPAKEGEEGKKARYITVAQVRELADFVNLSTHREGMRIVLLHPAETMNVQSANALLKTLEEPPPALLFLLVSHNPGMLLPTILSRCHAIRIPMPGKEAAAAWLAGHGIAEAEERLALAGGAPLPVLEADEAEAVEGYFDLLARPERIDPLAQGEGMRAPDVPRLVSGLQKWVYDLLRVRLAGMPRYLPGRRADLERLAGTADVSRLLALQKELLEARRYQLHPLNPQLVTEQLLFAYRAAWYR